MDKLISLAKKHALAVAVGIVAGVYLTKKHPGTVSFLPF